MLLFIHGAVEVYLTKNKMLSSESASNFTVTMNASTRKSNVITEDSQVNGEKMYNVNSVENCIAISEETKQNVYNGSQQFLTLIQADSQLNGASAYDQVLLSIPLLEDSSSYTNNSEWPVENEDLNCNYLPFVENIPIKLPNAKERADSAAAFWFEQVMKEFTALHEAFQTTKPPTT